MSGGNENLILPFFRALGLEVYLSDPEVTEIMITNGLVFVERGGQLSEIEGLTVNERTLKAGIEVLARSVGSDISEYHKPYLDARMPDGSRVAATYPPISPQGVVFTMRKFFRHFTTAELIDRGALTAAVLDLVLGALAARKNVLISGGTSTGKTTMTNAFVRHIPERERLCVIEQPMEMKLDQRCAVRFEAYPAIGDRPGFTVSQLLSLALRQRPDRIIVGEVKDSEAGFGLLQAMNTGHDGTFSTIHSNTALSALNRLASLAMPGFGNLDLARQETAAAIHVVVEVTRSRSGWRGVNSILEVDDYNDRTRRFETRELYRRAA